MPSFPGIPEFNQHALRFDLNATLLDAAGATTDGTWSDTYNLSPVAVTVEGTFVGTVQICISNAPSKPADTVHGVAYGTALTTADSRTIITKARWIKARVTAWTSGSISAYVAGPCPGVILQDTSVPGTFPSGLTIGSGGALLSLVDLLATTVDFSGFSPLAAGDIAGQTVTFTGALTTDAVFGVPSLDIDNQLTTFAWSYVAAADTVVVRIVNLGGAPTTLTNRTWRFFLFRAT